MLMVIYHGGLGINEVCGLEWRLVRPRDEGRYQGTVVGNGGKTRGVIPPARVASVLYSRHGATQAIRMPYSAVARVAAWTPLKCIGWSRQRQSGRHFLNTSSWQGRPKPPLSKSGVAQRFLHHGHPATILDHRQE